MLHRTRRTKDERGSILVLSTVGLVLALIAGGLAVDLGFVAQEARQNQKVADLAAMDAVRVLPSNPTSEAQASALRNNFPYTSPGYSLVVEWAPSVSGSFSSSAGTLGAATVVRVTATSPHDNMFPFVGDLPSVARSGTASVSDRARLSVGSKLLSLSNPLQGTAIDKMMTRLLGASTDFGLDLASYKGIAAGYVTLAELAAADASLGTVDQMLTSEVSLRKLAQASVTALNNRAAAPGGDTVAASAATFLGQFAGSINSNLDVSLGQVLALSAPAGDAAAAGSASLNVYDLIVASAQQAQIANGVNLITVPNMTVGISGLASSTLKLTLIEAPRLSALGPAQCTPPITGTCVTFARTAQMSMVLETSITIGPCPGLACLLTLTLPISLSAAKATANVTDIRCAAPESASQVDVRVDTQAVSETAAAVVKVSVLAPVAVPLGPVTLGSGNPEYHTFTGPFPTAAWSTVSSSLGLTSLVSTLPILGATLLLLNPIVSNIETLILNPVIGGLGLSVGGADVRAMQVSCGGSLLVN